MFWDDEWVKGDEPGEPSQDALIRGVCRDCPFRTECMEWGVKHERHGWWGGLSPDERAQMRKAWNITVKEPKHAMGNGFDWVTVLRNKREKESKYRMYELTNRDRLRQRALEMNEDKILGVE